MKDKIILAIHHTIIFKYIRHLYSKTFLESADGSETQSPLSLSDAWLSQEELCRKLFSGRAVTLFGAREAVNGAPGRRKVFGKERTICVCLETFLYLLMCVFQQPGNGPQKNVLFKEKSSGFGGITESKALGSHGCSLGIVSAAKSKAIFSNSKIPVREMLNHPPAQHNSLLATADAYLEGFALTTD